MAADLLSLAGSRPRAALARARELLARHPDADTAAVARQAAGVALRELGDTDAAAAELRVALRLARATGSPDRQADVLTSYGTVLIKAGRTRQGLAALDAAVRSAHGPLLGQVLMRRGGVLQILGRYPEAHADLRRALGMLRHDPIWAPRTRSGLGQVYLGLGATERADAEFAAAETQFARNGQRLETAFIKHNRAMTAFASGDLPARAAPPRRRGGALRGARRARPRRGHRPGLRAAGKRPSRRRARRDRGRGAATVRSRQAGRTAARRRTGRTRRGPV